MASCLGREGSGDDGRGGGLGHRRHSDERLRRTSRERPMAGVASRKGRRHPSWICHRSRTRNGDGRRQWNRAHWKSGPFGVLTAAAWCRPRPSRRSSRRVAFLSLGWLQAASRAMRTRSKKVAVTTTRACVGPTSHRDARWAAKTQDTGGVG